MNASWEVRVRSVADGHSMLNADVKRTMMELLVFYHLVDVSTWFLGLLQRNVKDMLPLCQKMFCCIYVEFHFNKD